jgi:hypothetical protein
MYGRKAGEETYWLCNLHLQTTSVNERAMEVLDGIQCLFFRAVTNKTKAAALSSAKED